MVLTGSQYRQLSEAFRHAFPPQRLTEMLRFRLGRNLADISLGSDYQQIVFELIRTAEAEGWTYQLIAAAREANPGNPKLLAFAQQFGLASDHTPSHELERIICQTNSFFDVEAWRTRLGELEARVCRVEVATKHGTACGTGFLVAPDVAITNYHVVQPVVEGRGAGPDDVLLQFDYKRLADRTTVNPGTR